MCVALHAVLQDITAAEAAGTFDPATSGHTASGKRGCQTAASAPVQDSSTAVVAQTASGATLSPEPTARDDQEPLQKDDGDGDVLHSGGEVPPLKLAQTVGAAPEAGWF